MIRIKDEYQKIYKQENKTLNVLLIEPIILECYVELIYEELNSQN
jgi:hypothetical protein